jgi:predicted nucleic acid-binding protein
VVVDTDVFSARLVPDSLLAQRYEPVLAGRAEFISFQTLAEVRYGAQLRRWGAARLRRLDLAVAKIEVVHSGDDLIRVYASLRVACARSGDSSGHPTGVQRRSLQGRAGPRVDLRRRVSSNLAIPLAIHGASSARIRQHCPDPNPHQTG